MKTIAILTLTFLPGTAIAVSIFKSREDFKRLLTRTTELLQYGNVQLETWSRRVDCIALPIRVLGDHYTSDSACVRCVDLVVQGQPETLFEAARRRPPGH